MQSQHIENSLGKIKLIFEKASERIDALKSGEKIAATELAKELGVEFGISGPVLYQTLLFLIKDYPGTYTKRGAMGGIYKI
jgi:hypothetical protein